MAPATTARASGRICSISSVHSFMGPLLNAPCAGRTLRDSPAVDVEPPTAAYAARRWGSPPRSLRLPTPGRPRVVDVACGSPEMRAGRDRAAAGLSGVMVELGFGSGLNVASYHPRSPWCTRSSRPRSADG